MNNFNSFYFKKSNFLLYFFTLLLIFSFYHCDNIEPLNPDLSDPIPQERPKPNTKITILSGNFQFGKIGQTLDSPAAVILTDLDGNTLKDENMFFVILDGEGNTSKASDKTNSKGEVKVDWTPGKGPDYILKICLPEDSDLIAEPAYFYANSHIKIKTRWISDIKLNMDGTDYEHDNRILESNHFLAFSEGSSDDSKIRFIKAAEETFHEILMAFSYKSPEDLGIYTDRTETKLTIYSGKSSKYITDIYCTTTGYQIYALDAYFMKRIWQYRVNFRTIIKHETTHLLQFLMGMSPYNYSEAWFSEGLAEFISDCRLFTPIETLDQFDHWRSIPGRENPISFSTLNTIGVEDHKTYYPMFRLAVKYLLHEKGYGKSLSDVKEMYLYMIETGARFDEAFEKYFGMSTRYFENNFYDFVSDFLSKL